MLRILSLLCLTTILLNSIYAQNPENVKYTVTHETWFDIGVMDVKGSNEYIKTGRIVIGLFGDICPMTVTNFAQLAKGFKRDKVKIFLIFNFF